ncbi:endonuclease/exonuclease/phosphatase family protein [Streptomyces sp. NPDC058646]|uniref:endonuclease/exonuclease/phosphatase family protein n=1 Tax=Streptomyces sp. NPDC058646 TaxID=3346574 RepID=UPI0036682C6F
MQRQMETGNRLPGRRLGRTVATLSLLASVACSSAQQAPASVTAAVNPDDVALATWNMCGVEQWGCEDTGGAKDKFQQLRDLVGDLGVRVLLLQEVCSEDLVASAVRLGPEWHSAFEPYEEVDAEGRRTFVDCTGEGRGRAGLGLLAASPLPDAEAVPTPQPTVGLHRGILCARVPAQGMRVCNAHIALRESDTAHPDWEFRDDQLRSLMTAAAAGADDRTVLGGDFNSPPPGAKNATAWVWPRELYATYRECDQKGDASRKGRPTYEDGTKIDYLFTLLPRTACEVVDTEASDHRPLVMRVSRPDSTTAPATGLPG